MNNLNNPEIAHQGAETSFFSARPQVKKMNLDMIYEPKDGFTRCPSPLSPKRNGLGCQMAAEKDDRDLGRFQPDEDVSGRYFGASIRKGPFMNKQEDRVSILVLSNKKLIF